MWPNPQFPEDLVTFTEEIPNGKLHFSCSVLKGWSRKWSIRYNTKPSSKTSSKTETSSTSKTSLVLYLHEWNHSKY